ncbi:NAD-dependent epimerase/dehydratase family protein [Pectobacterium versatile]|uniref:NAD-dependent epimerase/dehydratase family protein n=1 Tax=Pectobacterium versatile TaxID=2488639 RepID=UPI00102E3571|nr:NAD-dependent epimerase/dehydratase family protein [Pectobacterium versatile]TAI95246.1 NAD-dependent epimerase/dehydratase family protein [Pectobacterium versatile]UEQ08916.1 NAD-dependent epimerase/dehydratase family protein [Pectobacterium versatile]GKX40542.1 N-acetyl-alpha-D-glucosaminyl-diphospho-ditrans, octacis-undecaprenol 4-epimerase [Pectobacterium carotovorum subsp. carotovorum]GLX46661.1 N-acetyl-alpha-D-glucosaminyl-diphospho-ditrans, octacis-undecaprenol 4-epimerase [Pectobact
MNQYIAIVGGSGFIGTVLARKLVKENVNFKILDKNKSQEFPNAWEYCDVTKFDTIIPALNGVHTIINLAAEHKDNVNPTSLYYDVNVTGAKNVCEAAKINSIKNIIFTSSVAVYGFVEKETGEDGEYNPFNHYGKSKLEAEYVYDAWFAEDPSSKLVTIRPTVVFGENNRGNVYNLFRQIASGKFLMIGSGNNQKSMAYVENIAAFIHYVTGLSDGKYVFNYIDKPDFTMSELTGIINKALGKKESNIRVPYAVGLLGGYCFDVLSKITGREFPVSSIRIKKFCARTQFKSNFISDFDFVAPVPLSEGIARTVRNEFAN